MWRTGHGLDWMGSSKTSGTDPPRDRRHSQDGTGMSESDGDQETRQASRVSEIRKARVNQGF